jgi:hypothetical protein
MNQGEYGMNDQLHRQMTDIANGHQIAMRGMSGQAALAYVKDIIDNATIVIGIYQDVTSPNGVGMHVIKGAPELQAVVASGKTDQFAAASIPCIDLEQAIAAEQKLGDGLPKTN